MHDENVWIQLGSWTQVSFREYWRYWEPKTKPIRSGAEPKSRATRALTATSEQQKLENNQSAAQFIRGVEKHRPEDTFTDADTDTRSLCVSVSQRYF